MLKVKITLNPPRPSEQIEKFEKWFPGKLQAAHNGAVLNILECCVMWSRVDTGRFRGGFLAYPLQAGFPIQRSMAGGKNFSTSAQGEGVALSTVTRSFLSTYLENGVNYGEFLEDKVGTFDQEGVSAFTPSPFRGFQDAAAFFQEKYSQLMNKVMANMDKALEKKDFPEEPFVDFGPPGPAGDNP